MIEIVHDFSKPERENVESRLNNFGSKQLANVSMRVRPGYTGVLKSCKIKSNIMLWI